MSDDGWKMLRDLMTAVDSHRLANEIQTKTDEDLYAKVAQIRKELA
jgi:hypothetical protein